jgi:hypothetical protein
MFDGDTIIITNNDSTRTFVIVRDIQTIRTGKI